MNLSKAAAASRADPGIVAACATGGAGDCTEASVAHLMRRVVLSIAHHADKRLGARGLTGAQLVLLSKLRSSGPSSVVDLARGSLVNAGAMTRLLDRLEKKNLCKRKRSTVDRRVVRVEITAGGEAAVAQVCGWPAEVLNEHLAGLTKSEWRTLGSYLKRMVKAGEAMRESARSVDEASSVRAPV